MEPLVEFAAVSKRYRHRGPVVLDQVSLELEPGTLTWVRGENGSGKSTLLRLACGFSRPTRGNVRRGFTRLGFVPDRVVPPGRLTARAYLTHLGRLAGDPSALRAAGDLAGRLGLDPGLDAPLGTLSRGNLRKVILIQSLMRTVDLLVMDEPFAALDAAAAGELALLLGERAEGGSAVLVASHADHRVSGARTLVLRAGRLRTSDAPGQGSGGPVFAIVLDRPHPGSNPPGRALPDHGGVRYLVPADAVEQFLRSAWAAQVRVVRLNPAEPGTE